jgi:hypothetical protein
MLFNVWNKEKPLKSHTGPKVCPSPNYQLHYIIRHVLDVKQYNTGIRIYMRFRV